MINKLNSINFTSKHYEVSPRALGRIVMTENPEKIQQEPIFENDKASFLNKEANHAHRAQFFLEEDRNILFEDVEKLANKLSSGDGSEVDTVEALLLLKKLEKMQDRATLSGNHRLFSRINSAKAVLTNAIERYCTFAFRKVNPYSIDIGLKKIPNFDEEKYSEYEIARITMPRERDFKKLTPIQKEIDEKYPSFEEVYDSKTGKFTTKPLK